MSSPTGTSAAVERRCATPCRSGDFPCGHRHAAHDCLQMAGAPFVGRGGREGPRPGGGVASAGRRTDWRQKIRMAVFAMLRSKLHGRVPGLGVRRAVALVRRSHARRDRSLWSSHAERYPDRTRVPAGAGHCRGTIPAIKPLVARRRAPRRRARSGSRGGGGPRTAERGPQMFHPLSVPAAITTDRDFPA